MNINLFDISVIPLEENLTMSGVPDILESGTTAELTCTVRRIRPEASDMFWIIGGRRIDGSVHSSLNQNATSLKQYNIIYYS